jgi:hypothetical protein
MKAGLCALLQSLILPRKSSRDSHAVEGWDVISWLSSLSDYCVVFCVKKNQKTVPKNFRSARLDSTYRSLFWENRELHKW